MSRGRFESPIISAADELSLKEISERWSREPKIQGHEKILELMIAAIFRREFSGKNTEGDSVFDHLDFLLVTLADAGGLPNSDGVQEIVPDPPPPALSIKEQTIANSPQSSLFFHGDQVIDLNRLANTPIEGFPENGRNILEGLTLSRKIFLLWCEEREFKFPKFWRRPSDRSRSLPTVNLETKCINLIKEKAAQGQRIPRSTLEQDAMKKLPGLGKRQFARAWEMAAPPEWKQSGRIARAPSGVPQADPKINH